MVDIRLLGWQSSTVAFVSFAGNGGRSGVTCR
jgi:hypothetical protein